MVFPDQMRGQALGFLGEDPVHTPNLDRFAEQSLVLPQAVSNSPVCSPFRGMLMTGKYPIANQVVANCKREYAKYGVELREDETCWSDILTSGGYNLGYIGKWHLDLPREPYGEFGDNMNEWCQPHRRHGFDFWYSYGTFNNHLRPMYWDNDAGRYDFHRVEEWGPRHEANMAIRYIRNEGGAFRDPDRPFALTVSMNPPHTPYELFPRKYLEPYRNKTDRELLPRPNVDTSGETEMSRFAFENIRNYFACVTGVDDQFGRVLSALEEENLEQETIVLFFSDHGDCIGAHNLSHKNNPYEESMRIPFLIRWPGHISPRRDDLLLSAPDICPTLLELAGFKTEIPSGVEGTSHASLFLGHEGPRPSSQLYLRIPPEAPDCGERGVRTHDYKLTIGRKRSEEHDFDSSTERHKAGRHRVRPDLSETLLIDRRQDPYELNNIAGSRPDLVQQLIQNELTPWLEHTKDPFPLKADL